MDTACALGLTSVTLLLGVLLLSMYMGLKHEPAGGKTRSLFNLLSFFLAVGGLGFALGAAIAFGGDCWDCVTSSALGLSGFKLAVGPVVAILAPFFSAGALLTALGRILQDRRARSGKMDGGHGVGGTDATLSSA